VENTAVTGHAPSLLKREDPGRGGTHEHSLARRDPQKFLWEMAPPKQKGPARGKKAHPKNKKPPRGSDCLKANPLPPANSTGRGRETWEPSGGEGKFAHCGTDTTTITGAGGRRGGAQKNTAYAA